MHDALTRALAAAASLALSLPVLAVDLSVASIEVTQGFQNGSTTLVGGRSTMVRAKVAISGSAGPVQGVDAVLRMFVNGVESSAGPFYSMNGPIVAPLSPSSGALEHTLNFIVVPPVSGQVSFRILVNPTASVTETNTANNLFISGNYAFVCRAVVDLAYVAINYTPSGGLPPLDMMEPGSADNFLRGIFAVGDWNYHRSPLGALTWTQNVNNTGSALLNALADIRNVQIPNAGYGKPEFVYGFLPGNPYSGNGLANGVPGIVAFGNTTENRWQRTFAHEIGHLWGLAHNSATIGQPSVDVEHHLKDPLGLPQLHASTKSDVMVAGLLTPAAWVAAGTYNKCLSDPRSQCSSAAGPDGDGDGGDSDARGREVPCLRVAGVLTHQDRSVALDPIFVFDQARPTVDDPAGDVAIEALDAAGRVVHRVRLRTDTMRESCCGTGRLNATAPIYALLPKPDAGVRVDRVVIRDLAPAAQGRVMTSRVRSAQAPRAEITSAWPAIAAPAPQGGAWKANPIEVTWSATDDDGDDLSFMLLYSPNGGGRWAPVSVNPQGESIIFDPSGLPGAEPGRGLLRLLVSDGFNTSVAERPIESLFMQLNPPDVHILSPNADTYWRGASVVLHASGWDLEDEYLPGSAFSWWSDRDGPLGVGRLLTTRSLSPGDHQISVIGIDSDGMTTTRVIAITISPRSIPTADIDGNGLVDGADLAMLLGNWGNFGVGDLNFDGVVDGQDLSILLGNWTP
ncbi:MAG: hypothetical protein KF724_02890 [Phycisphaeraceae bacterium]|nr:hypothetical protein [Phycisphaeraceae bacterium]